VVLGKNPEFLSVLRVHNNNALWTVIPRRLSRADGAVLCEALAYADVSTTANLTIHNSCASLVERWVPYDLFLGALVFGYESSSIYS
jgi:hypothetical protein